jgi:hypothetical protein
MSQLRSHLVRSVVAATSVLALVACSAGPAPKSTVEKDDKTACVGGFCLHPDHVVARKVQGSRGRCLIIAWDGTESLPPTAKVGAVDDSPGARPGVFAAIDVPSLRDGFSYPIASDLDDAKPGSASVFAVRIDPGVRFADQRVADSGDVMVLAQGAERILVVKAKWNGGKKEETASFVIPKAYNQCTNPADLP